MFSVRNTCRPGVGGPILFIFFQKAILPIANLLLEATEQLTHTKVDNEGTCCSLCMKLQLTKKLFYSTYSNITYNILCRGKNILRKKKNYNLPSCEVFNQSQNNHRKPEWLELQLKNFIYYRAL